MAVEGSLRAKCGCSLAITLRRGRLETYLFSGPAAASDAGVGAVLVRKSQKKVTAIDSDISVRGDRRKERKCIG
jgi:hypothetical protein